MAGPILRPFWWLLWFSFSFISLVSQLSIHFPSHFHALRWFGVLWHAHNYPGLNCGWGGGAFSPKWTIFLLHKPEGLESYPTTFGKKLKNMSEKYAFWAIVIYTQPQKTHNSNIQHNFLDFFLGQNCLWVIPCEMSKFSEKWLLKVL